MRLKMLFVKLQKFCLQLFYTRGHWAEETNLPFQMNELAGWAKEAQSQIQPSPDGHFMVENVRRQLRPVSLDFLPDLVESTTKPLLLRQVKQPSNSVGFHVRVGIIVGPRKMMGFLVGKNRTNRFLVDHVQSTESSLVIKTPSIRREATGENQQTARHQQLLKLGPGEQAVAALDATVLGAVSHDVDQTCSALEGADETGFRIIVSEFQHGSGFFKKPVKFFLLRNHVGKGSLFIFLFAGFSMPHKHADGVREACVFGEGFQPAVSR